MAVSKSENKPKTTKRTRKTKNTGPKKPSSSFMCFSKEQRVNIIENNPTIKFGQVGKLLGEMWRGMSEEQKEKYNEMAEQDKQRYKTEMAAVEEAAEANAANEDEDEEDDD